MSGCSMELLLGYPAILQLVNPSNGTCLVACSQMGRRKYRSCNTWHIIGCRGVSLRVSLYKTSACVCCVLQLLCLAVVKPQFDTCLAPNCCQEVRRLVIGRGWQQSRRRLCINFGLATRSSMLCLVASLVGRFVLVLMSSKHVLLMIA